MGIMKNVLFVLVLVVFGFCVFSGSANAIQYGAYTLTASEEILNTTLTTAETVYPVTLESGTISINIQAIGGTIKKCIGGTTTEAYWTIPQNSVYFDHIPVPYEKNRILYFYSSTAGARVEILRTRSIY